MGNIVFARKIPAIKRDAQSTAYGTIGVNGQNAVAFSDQTQGSMLYAWGKQMHSWVQALLVAATYPYGSAANSLSQSHTFSILVDYYAYSCLLCSLAPPSLQLACLPGNKHAPKGSDRKLRW